MASLADSAAARASWASAIAASRSWVRSATRASRTRFCSSSSAYRRADSIAPANSDPTVNSRGPSAVSSARPSRRSSTTSTPTTRPCVTSGLPTYSSEPRTAASRRFGSSASWAASRKRSGPSAVARMASVEPGSSSGTRRPSTSTPSPGGPPATRQSPTVRVTGSTSAISPRENPSRPTISASPRSRSWSSSSVELERDPDRVDSGQLREPAAEILLERRGRIGRPAGQPVRTRQRCGPSCPEAQ